VNQMRILYSAQCVSARLSVGQIRPSMIPIGSATTPPPSVHQIVCQI